jgi:hypothetical protein
MTFPPLFKKSLIYSLLGHLTVLSIFSFSFGRRLPSAADYAKVAFWGDFLAAYQVSKPLSAGYDLARDSINNIGIIKGFFARKPETGVLKNTEIKPYAAPKWYIKPQLVSGFGVEKRVFVRKTAPERFVRKSTEPSIMFHPVLPYDFTIYFKDRQVAHVELMFNIVSSGKRNSIEIKRKVSSGNPEVDLLTMRYISHYLFMQENRFSPDNWQTVKIDLSAKK